MAKKYVQFNSTEDAQSYREKVDRVSLLPRRGFSFNGVPIGPATPPGKGWTLYKYDKQKKTSGNKWKVRTIDIDTEGDKDQLTPTEQDEMRALHATATEVNQNEWEDDQGEDEQ